MRLKWMVVGLGVAQIAALVVSTLTLASVRRLLVDVREERRAWVLVPSINFYGSVDRLERDQAFQLNIPYPNVGRAPAFDVRMSVEDGYADIGKPAFSYSKLDLPPKDMCAEPMPRLARYVFPSPGQDVEDPYGQKPSRPQDLFTSVDERKHRNLTVTDAFLNGNAQYYVRGCLRYRTAGIEAHTAFCYFGYKADAETVRAGEPFLTAECESGNEAE